MWKKALATVTFVAFAAGGAWGAKTVFSDGNPSLGIKGTRVYAAFLNALNNHDHHGADDDGSGPQIENADVSASAAIAKSKISTSGTWTNSDLPATTVHSDNAAIFEANGTTVKNATLAATATNAGNATGWNSKHILTEYPIWDSGLIGAGDTAITTFTVTGAGVNNVVLVGPPSTPSQSLIIRGYVTATDTVAIYVTNLTAGALTGPSGTWRVYVINN